MKRYIKSSKSISTLKGDLTNAVKEYMCGPKGGFDLEPDPNDRYSMYWGDYAVVKVGEPNKDGYAEVRINAELDYDSFEDLFELANPVLESYDKDAYFEMEDPGRAVAYVKVK